MSGGGSFSSDDAGRICGIPIGWRALVRILVWSNPPQVVEGVLLSDLVRCSPYSDRSLATPQASAIVFVKLQRMIDGMGFGDMGIPELNAIRGYSTPAISEFADEGTRLARIYTAPSCTPTR